MTAPAPRSYALPSGELLVECGRPRAIAFSVHDDGAIEIEDGLPIEPRLFELRRPDGTVARHFSLPHSVYSLDDYLYVQDIYFVRGSTLHSAMLELGWRASARLSNERIELEGLRLI